MKELLIFAISAILLYGGATLLQAISLAGRLKPNKAGLLIGGSFAVGLHAWFLYHCIDMGGGQNLNIFNMLSLIFAVASGLLILTAIGRAVENLCLLLYPLAAFSIILVGVFPRQYIIHTAQDPQQLIHILLSIITVSFMCIAAAQALALAWQERLLKSHKVGHWIQIMPALQTMEVLLFQTLWIGFILLTLVIVSAWYSLGDLMSTGDLPKIVVSFLAWLIYAILLLGRHLAGWRGKLAVNFTLLGFALLAIAYFGSELLMMYK